MREMKKSGIEWIGDIPTHWNIRKGKWILKRLERPVEENDGVITCFRDGDVTLRSNRREEGFTFSLQEVGYQGIEPGDLVVHGMDGFAGAIGISDSRGKGTPVLNILDSTEDKKYIMYYLRNMAYNGIFLALATGIRVRSCDTNWNKLKELPYIIPTIEEQSKIAEYLTKVCAEIDAVIAKTKATIEEYKKLKQSIITEAVTKGVRGDRPMKISGIEWIGDIPFDWEISRIKYVSEFEPSSDKNGLNEDSVITYTPMDCIKNGWFINQTARLGSVSSSLTAYQNGDIVMAKVTPCFENGNIAIMENLSSGYGLGSSELFVFRAKSIDTKFLFYWLRNDRFMQSACSTMTGTGGLKRVSPTFIKNCYLHLPPVEEQKEIANYLDKKCAEMDTLIDRKTALLAEMETYKKSVIYEYVTGKKEVK